MPESPPSLLDRILGRLVDVRDGEAELAVRSGLYFFFLLASYFILRPIRDAMGVAAGVSKLPWLFLGTLVATLICQPLFAALASRFPARKFIPIAYQFFALNLVVFWLALRGQGELSTSLGMPLVFFVWTSVFNLFVVSVFWSFMADVFRSEQAARLFGFIGVGGTLGGMVGAGITASLAKRIGPVNLLLVSLVLLEIATVIVARFPRVTVSRGPVAAGAVDQTGVGGSIWAGFSGFAKSPYLIGIGTFLVLYTAGSTFLYFQQAQIIGAHFDDAASRTALLGTMEFASQLITVVTQLFFTGKIIEKLGLGMTLALMPALSILGFVAIGLSGLGIIPALGAFVVFSVLRRGSNFALTNPAMEVLYTVVPREDKYKAKNFIETFVYRSGDQLSAWTYAGLAALGLTATDMAWPAALLSATFLATGLWLGRQHRRLAARSDPA